MDASTSGDDFAKPTLNAGRFDNPTSFNNWGGVPGLPSILKWKLVEKDNENVPNDEKLDETIPVRHLKSFEPKNAGCKLYAAWLGHATMLVHMEGVNVITDPIWAERASFSSLAGPKRYRPPPMEIKDLPPIDFAVISHDHYDHLDAAAVKTINDNNPRMKWFVPLNMKKWMQGNGIEGDVGNEDGVTEMNWGENKTISIKTRESGEHKNFTIWCLPAQHWGQRGPFDRNWRLWSGWAVKGSTKSFYYTGDTGFCDKEFEKIGRKLGPFDLAAIPIGAYEPRWFMKSQHINPEEAIQLHELVRSKFSIGIHWGTYHMGSYEFYLEPRDKIAELMKQKRANESDTKPFETIQMGGIWEEESTESTETSQ